MNIEETIRNLRSKQAWMDSYGVKYKWISLKAEDLHWLVADWEAMHKRYDMAWGMTTKELIQQWQMMRYKYVVELLAQLAGDDLSKLLLCLEKERDLVVDSMRAVESRCKRAEASLEISENMRHEIRVQLESLRASKRPADSVER
jgi:hypothetical protein